MSKQTVYSKVDILGIEVDAVNMAEAIDYITELAGNPSSPSCYIVKPYVEFLDRAHRSKELAALLNGSEMCLPDGVALQWAASFLHGGPLSKKRFWGLAASIVLWPQAIRNPLAERFGGITFSWPLLRAARDQELRVYLIGTPRHASIHHTARAIRHNLVGIQIVGVTQGEIDGRQGAELISHLRKHPPSKEFMRPILETKPDIILVGMGFPLQEYVMARLVDELPHGVLIGEGGTFDYDSFGGNLRKAPAMIRKIGLEWLWRLFLEPSRWRRQMAIPRFMSTLYRHTFPKSLAKNKKNP